MQTKTSSVQSWIAKTLLPLLLLFPFAVAAQAADPEIINPKIIYEIKSYSGSYFQYIASAAAGDDGGLYLLAGPPDSVAAYRRDSGTPWRRIKLDVGISQDDSIAPCGERIFITHGKSVHQVTDKGALVAFMTTDKDGKAATVTADFILCDNSERLVTVDRAKLEIRRYNMKGESDLKIAPPESDADKKDAFPLRSVSAVALDAFGRFFVLDRASRGIFPFATNGKPTPPVPAGRFSESPFPFDSDSMAVDPQRNLWLVNRNYDSIDSFNTFGSPVKRIENRSGSGPRFFSATKIFIDREGRLFVIDPRIPSLLAFNTGTGYN